MLSRDAPAAIRVRNLSKEYGLGQMEPYQTLRDTIAKALRLGRPNSTTEATGSVSGKIWALKDVSFDIAPGEVVGIIGHNGAGKSTLLKILSRITEPTSGEAEILGRVASLLEVGTGFHPELTGRENVYLNGSILGMRKKEIDAKFDEIIAFSGVEKFLDTPVKRYSSGMQVRLAFSVAAHLEPEILFIDEVLAVGDAEFQRKCLGKMSDVARDGRTILFVSHNMAAVENLCTRGVLLERGGVKKAGPIGEVIQCYLEANQLTSGDVDAAEHLRRMLGAKPVIQRFQILDRRGGVSGQIGMGEEVTFILRLQLAQRVLGLAVGIHLHNWLGQRVTTLHTGYQTRRSIDQTGDVTVRCQVPRLDLMPGLYQVTAALGFDGGMLDRIDPVTSFEIMQRDIFETGRLPPAQDGVFFCHGHWDFERSPVG